MTAFQAGSGLQGEIAGEGPDIVCLHGLTATRRYVLHGSRMLERSGRRVIAYDARGHGESRAAVSYRYHDLAGDLRAVLEATGAQRPVLVGSSMGAATAMAHALEHPRDVRALVQITPAYDGRERDLARWDALAAACERGDIDAFVERAALGGGELVRQAIRQRMERHRDLEAVAQALRQVPRSMAFELDRLASLELPVLIVASRDETDPGHPLAVARTYAERLPRATVVVEESGKSPLAWQGAQLSRAIAEFLDQA